MTDYQGLVREFHETFGHPIAETPRLLSTEMSKLRFDLIAEELEEYGDAISDRNLVEVADALTDILYVTFGAMVAHGLPADKLFEEVQRSNMSKLGEDGKPIYREDGKILKGPGFTPPNLRAIVEGEWIEAVQHG